MNDPGGVKGDDDDTGNFSAAHHSADAAAAPSPRHRRRHARRMGDAHAGSPSWLVSFTDVMGLMLTFFVMMFAMGEPAPESWSDIRAALNSELNKYPDPVWEPAAEEEVRLPRTAYDRALDLRYLNSLLRGVLDESDGLDAVRIEEVDGVLLISLSQGAIFSTGGTSVSAGGEAMLRALGERLLRIPNRIEVEVYSSNLGDSAEAWAQALFRAAQVAGELRRSGYEKPVDVRGRAPDPAGLVPSQGGGQINIVIKNHEGQN